MTAPTIVIDSGSYRSEWCDDCQRGSAIAADLLHLRDDGVRMVGRVRRCLECQPFDDEEEGR